MFNRRDQERQGCTTLLIPSFGRGVRFGSIRAGDFFMESGRLYLKINLEEAVEISSGSQPIIGTSAFSEAYLVYVVNVQIEIKSP